MQDTLLFKMTQLMLITAQDYSQSQTKKLHGLVLLYVCNVGTLIYKVKLADMKVALKLG